MVSQKQETHSQQPRCWQSADNYYNSANMKKEPDLKLLETSIKRLLTKRYKPKPKIGDIFENIALFFIICLSIIFRPINLIIGGIITIIILLLI